jgi:predicted PurR-regulated permease PerM
MAWPDTVMVMSKQKKISYSVMLVTFILAGWMTMAPLLLAALFSYFALTKLRFGNRLGKWAAVVLFLVLLSGAFYALGHFVNQSIEALPRVADKAIPAMVKWAAEHGVEPPFRDFDGLKEMVFDQATGQVSSLRSAATLARGATRQIVFFVIGIVAAVSLFIHARFELDRATHPQPNNLYYLAWDEIAERFVLFFRSFTMVMGAQIIISAINTSLTAIFVLSIGLPHPVVVLGVTFLCGLLPVLGNLISNAVIVAIGFTVSPQTALSALIFLIVIHKLEYFLNSKIIGDRIRNPVWLTLLGLVIGEKLMGVPGMILAPVVLHYLKMEVGQLPVKDEAGPSS